MTRSYSEMPALCLADLAVGDALPILTKRTDPLGTVLFCAAIRNFHRLHYDEAFCREEGFGGVIVPGFQSGNWCLEAVTRGFGTAVRVKRLNFRNRANALVGDVFTIQGRVAEVADAQSPSLWAACEVSVEGPSGQTVTTARVEIVQRARKSG